MAHYHCVIEQLPYWPPEQLDEAASINDYATRQVTAMVGFAFYAQDWPGRVLGSGVIYVGRACPGLLHGPCWAGKTTSRRLEWVWAACQVFLSTHPLGVAYCLAKPGLADQHFFSA